MLQMLLATTAELMKLLMRAVLVLMSLVAHKIVPVVESRAVAVDEYGTLVEILQLLA